MSEHLDIDKRLKLAQAGHVRSHEEVSATQAEELLRKGETTYKRVYEGDLRAHLEATAWGKYFALDIESGGYLVADSEEVALAEFRNRFPNGFPYLIRIGLLRLLT